MPASVAHLSGANLAQSRCVSCSNKPPHRETENADVAIRGLDGIMAASIVVFVYGRDRSKRNG
jgi:hypothetical protein